MRSFEETNPYLASSKLQEDLPGERSGIVASVVRLSAFALMVIGAWLLVFMLGMIPMLNFLGHLEALVMAWALLSLPIAMLIVASGVQMSRRTSS